MFHYQLPEELDVKKFQALNAWLRCWKERSNTTFYTVSGEFKPITLYMVNTRWETSYSAHLSNYDLEDIYHAYDF